VRGVGKSTPAARGVGKSTPVARRFGKSTPVARRVREGIPAVKGVGGGHASPEELKALYKAGTAGSAQVLVVE